MDSAGVKDVAGRLIAAYDEARTLQPIAAGDASFDVPAGYRVLAEIQASRAAQGWKAVGRKIGFTNTTIWARYGVDRPLWANVYDRTVRHVPDGRVEVSLERFAQPRIEPEVVFGLRSAVPAQGSAREVLESVAWMAPGFEVVQCHFPGWKFAAADCTAAFGLHGALFVGAPKALDDAGRDAAAQSLARFACELFRDGGLVERGGGANVLGSPALALQHLARVLESQPWAAPLRAGEIVTTGTLTDAWPLAPGTTWRSDYGELGLPGFELSALP